MTDKTGAIVDMLKDALKQYDEYSHKLVNESDDDGLSRHELNSVNLTGERFFRAGYQAAHQARDAWQDISTAPKDEDATIIGRMGVVVCSMTWDDEDKEWWTFNRMWERIHEKYPNVQKWNPTHWMHLPTPPQTSGDGS